MYKKLKSYSKKYIQYIFYLLVFTSLFLLFAGDNNTEYQNKNSMLSFGIYAVAISFCLFVLYQQIFINIPFKHISKKLQELSENDFSSLSRSLTELSRGNLTTNIKLRSETLDISMNNYFSEMAEGLNSIISNLRDASQDFNSATDAPCQRLVYVGADSYLEGRQCAEAMGRVLNGKGKVTIIVERINIIGQELRRKGFQNFINEKYPQIKIYETVESDNNVSKTYNQTKYLLNKYPDINGIYIAHGGEGAAKYLSENNKIGQIKVVCHDLGEETMRYVQQGVITATLSQDVIAQGHDPIIHVFNRIADNWNPPRSRMLTKLEMVTPENYPNFWHPQRGIIESADTTGRRPNPIRPSAKQIKIAVLGREGASFWDGLKTGVDSATKKLLPFNASVDWIIPDNFRTKDGFDVSAKIYGSAIDKCIEKKYDAICTGIFDKNLIPYIDQAVQAGIVVATFNSEPLSLRGLFKTLANRILEISDISHKLIKATNKSLENSESNSKAIEDMVKSLDEESDSLKNANSNLGQIAEALERIASDSSEQKFSSEKVVSSAMEISEAINSANQIASKVVDASQGAISVAKKGAESVMHNLDQMKVIEDIINQFAVKIEEMARQSREIEEIIQTIESIAEQTNLLSLNAAIEAARAGEHGRGFAVVADEVRKLAERSAKATKQTTTMINKVQKDIEQSGQSIKSIVEKVKEGTKTASVSGDSIQALLNTSQDMNAQIDEVANANNRISKIMDGLVQSIERISQVIDQNMNSTQQLNRGVKQTFDMLNTISSLSNFNFATIKEILEKTTRTKNEAAELERVAEGLSAFSNELQSSTAQFKID